MERKKNLLMLMAFLLLFLVPVQSSTLSDARKQIYEAYVSNRMAEWELVMADYAKKANSREMYYNLAEFYYGYIGYCLSAKLYGKASHYLEEGEANLDRILSIDPGSGTAYAMKGAFIGYRIVLSKFKAIYLGPKSLDYIQKAVKLEPSNPAGWIETANADYYRPSYLGGSKQRALKNYEKAVGLYEQVPSSLVNNWMYLALLTNLAKANEATGNLKKAKDNYEKILRIEPDYLWVKDDLYPALLKKLPNG